MEVRHQLALSRLFSISGEKYQNYSGTDQSENLNSSIYRMPISSQIDYKENNQKSPGMSAFHYSPITPLKVYKNLQDLEASLPDSNATVILPSKIDTETDMCSEIPYLSEDGIFIKYPKIFFRHFILRTNVIHQKLNVPYSIKKAILPCLNDRILRQVHLTFIKFLFFSYNVEKVKYMNFPHPLS